MLAYPVILAAMYGVCRLGRQERWGAFEWLRLGTLGLMMGLLVAVQVKLVMLGVVRDPWTMMSAVVSVAGMGCLVGLYLWEVWEARDDAARAQDAARSLEDVTPQ